MNRLLCIVVSLDAGGAETFLMKVFRALPEDYKLDFIVFRSNGIYESEVVSLGGKIYKVPTHSEHPLRAFRSIYNIVKNNKYKNILKLSDTPIGVFDLVAARMAGAKHLCVRSCNAASDCSRVKTIINTVLRPLFNYLAKVKVAPSELAGRFTFGDTEFDKGNVTILRNGLNLSEYQFDKEKREIIREKYQIQNKFVIGNVGRFTSQKNHAFLLDVFREITKQNPDAILLLVGDGELKQQLVEKAKQIGVYDKIVFAGLQKDVVAYYSAMDVYVHTSLYEGMPNTIIEAQATNLNCLISDTITREANVTGLVSYLPLKDPQIWASQVKSTKMNNRQGISEEMCRNGYSIDDVRANFCRLFFEED